VKLEIELALRFLRRRSGALLRGTALAALSGVALATAALVITLALMAGYVQAIATALQQGNAHAVGFAPSQLELAHAQELARSLREIPGVTEASPVAYLMGLMEDPAHPAAPHPIVLKGMIDPPSFSGIQRWPATPVLPVIAGKKLARTLALTPGQSTSILLPPIPGRLRLPTIQAEVVGTFSLAFSEFDQRWVIAPLERLVTVLPSTGATGIELLLADPMQVERVRTEAHQRAPELVFTDWREMNRPLFAALRWQTISLFVVLSLVVAVAAFQVTSSLVVLAINKRRTTGMLQALGATPSRIRRILVLAGTLLGLAGVLTGVVFGVAASMVLSSFRLIRFPQGLAEVYMVDYIPFTVEPQQLCAVLGVCCVLVVAASWWPAWRASLLDPVAALKAV